MNLRIGAFGRQEAAAAVWVCTVISGCFAFDNRALFSDGNASYLAYAIAAVLAWLMFECTARAIQRRGGLDFNTLIGSSKVKKAIASFLILSLLLAAMQPQQQFLLTVTQYVFVDAKQTAVCLYLLPCLLLLTLLGAEPLVRVSRLIAPMLLLSIVTALTLQIPQARAYRLYPIPIGKPAKLLTDAVTALYRAFAPFSALLCIGEGTQNRRSLMSAGRIGACAGAITVLAMLLGLSFGFSYAMLAEMPSPFYRLLVEARTENPTLRLDRVALFLWMTGALLASAVYIYAAAVLFCKTFGVRDVRPIAALFAAFCVASILVLYYDTEATVRILKLLYRFGWLAAVVPLPLLCIARKEKQTCAA